MANLLQEALLKGGLAPSAPVLGRAPVGQPTPVASTANPLTRALLEPPVPVAPRAVEPELPGAAQIPAPKPIVAPPGQESEKPRPMSIREEIKNGFLGELSSAVQILRNLSDGPARIARRYVRLSGEPLADALERTTEFFEQARQSLEPPPVAGTTAAERIIGKVVRGVAAAPVMMAEYGLATLAFRNPLLAFAAVDAAREAHLGIGEATKAGAMGAATGAVLGAVGRIGSAPSRVALTGAAMGSAAGARGAPAEDVIAATLTGGVFGALSGQPAQTGQQTAQQTAQAQPSRQVRSPVEIISPSSRVPQTTPAPGPRVQVAQGVEIHGLDPTVPPLAAWYMSPSVWSRLVPEAQDAVYTAILSERHAARLQSKWETAIRKIEVSLDKDSRDRLVRYLDDPQYTLDNLPRDTRKVQQAFIEGRSLLNEIRDRIRQAKDEAGAVDPYAWGMEEGYFPHGERGYWRILSDGEPVPNGWIAKTKAEALQKAAEFKALHPTSPDPVIEFRPGLEAPPGYGRSGRKYWGHSMAREAGMPGLIGGWESMYDYAAGAARYAVYAPLRTRLLEARQAIETAYPGSRLLKAWDKYMDQVEGRPGPVTAALNDWMVEKGFKPNAVERGLGYVRSVETLLKLGYSPITALVNMFQVPINTFPVLGAKWTMKGYKGFFENAATGRYNWLLDELAVRDAVTKADELALAKRLQLYAPRSMKEAPRFVRDQAMALGLFMFSRAEYANRAVTVIGAYERARAVGLTKEQAVRKALEADVRTQFSIGQADAMRILANPWSRTAFQLRSFWAKQIEFMLGLTRKDIPGRFDSRAAEMGRFFLATLAAGGLAAIPGAQTLDGIVEKATGYSLLKRLWKKGPAAESVVYGIPTTAGVDVSQNVGFGDWFTWQNLSDPFGPAVRDLRNLMRVVRSFRGRDFEREMTRFWRGASPEFRRLWDSYLGPAAQRGELVDIYGRPIVQNLTEKEKALLFFGFTPRRVAQERRIFGAEQAELLKKQSEERGYVDRGVELIQQGRANEVGQLVREAREKGIPVSAESIWRRYRRLTQPRVELQRRVGRRYGIGEEEEEGEE